MLFTGNSGGTNRGFTLTAGTSSTIDVYGSPPNSYVLLLSGASAATTGSLTKAGAGEFAALVNVDRLDLIRAEAGRSSFETLNNMINQIILTGSFLDQNANPKLAMGVLGFSVARKA